MYVKRNIYIKFYHSSGLRPNNFSFPFQSYYHKTAIPTKACQSPSIILNYALTWFSANNPSPDEFYELFLRMLPRQSGSVILKNI